MRKFRTLDEFEEEYFRKHPEEIDNYLTEIFQEYAEENDSGALLASLRVVARVRGISEIAEQIGMTRRGLQKALSSNGNPRLENVNSIMKALGYCLTPTTTSQGSRGDSNMSQKLAPAKVPTPGKILSRELEARGWTQKDLAEVMGRPVQSIDEIIQGSKQITPEIAIELSQALGTSPEFWTNLEVKYQLHLVGKEKKEQDIARKSRLYTIAPISELIKNKWIQATDSIDDLERQICNFFGISSLDETLQLAVNFRCSEHREPEETSRITWVKRVENLAKQQTVASFEREKIEIAIPEILACAKQVESIVRIPRLLADLGVHFLIVPHLSKTYLDGAALYLNSNPVIALTLRYDRIDSFWFTLMHELAHIVLGHQGAYLDNLDALEENEEEKEANKKAANWLINSQKLNEFIISSKKAFSCETIEEFAQNQNRHPGIILGRLHYDKLVPYKNFRSLLVKVSPILGNSTDNFCDSKLDTPQTAEVPTNHDD
ncbi:putative addiction module antidote protein [Nostoc sp. XA010]|uniref:addiction module antidote protein n=1 Tax=Nostoc sp. XA010 TaxID=2780407 RepID=UPI001E51BDFE|nr:addiction module antidote protein [Nostoc sp. XA010]MCC5659790.1 putative addiction module antidote protein [Nostoc sp. XA010]